MSGFRGEAECKMDSKGRILMPAIFLRQMLPEMGTAMVINRGLEKCLTLYTLVEWERVTAEMQNLNMYDSQHRRFVRQFSRGATDIVIDKNKRVLIPKRLIEYAGLKKELVLLGYNNQIEIWDKVTYDEVMDIDPTDFAALASKVMGDK